MGALTKPPPTAEAFGGKSGGSVETEPYRMLCMIHTATEFP